MKKVSALLLGLALGTSLLYSCKKDDKADPLATSTASANPARGLALYIADPGKAVGGSICQIEVSRLRLVGKPLTEENIDYFDQSKGQFKLKVSQYDWLRDNLKAMSDIGGYHAMALTLDGKAVFAGYALSGFSSMACHDGQPFFWEDATYQAPNPGPNPRNEYSYVLPVKKIVAINTPAEQQIPTLDASILARLEKIGKLKK